MKLLSCTRIINKQVYRRNPFYCTYFWINVLKSSEWIQELFRNILVALFVIYFWSTATLRFFRQPRARAVANLSILDAGVGPGVGKIKMMPHLYLIFLVVFFFFFSHFPHFFKNLFSFIFMFFFGFFFFFAFFVFC